MRVVRARTVETIECTRCLVTKPEEDFPTGRRQCKKCRTELKTIWNKSHRAQHLAAKAREQRKRLYGVTEEKFNTMVMSQTGCAICGAPEPGGRGAWHIDHDHSCCPGIKSCGKCIRGLLCLACNMRLGVVENHDWVALAKEYLKSHA